MTHEEEWRRRHAAEIADAWENLLRQPWGRMLLFEVLDSVEFCGVDASTFRESSAEQSYRNGMRDAGLRLRTVAQLTNPELYIRMVAEAMNERRLLLAAKKSDAERRGD